MQMRAFHGTALAVAMALPLVVLAQSTGGTQSSGQQAQSTRSGNSTGTRAAQSDSNDWQEAGKTDTHVDADAGSRQAATTGDDFDTLDTDHDGRISHAEAGASQDFNGRFKTLDSDGDGYVSNSEYREGLRATRTPTTTP